MFRTLKNRLGERSNNTLPEFCDNDDDVDNGCAGGISTEGMMLRKRLMVSAVLSGLLLYHRGVHHGWRPIGEWTLKASPLSLLGQQ